MKYIEFIEDQAKIAKPNSLLFNSIKASEKLLGFIEDNIQFIDENKKKDILIRLDVNEKKEENIIFILQRIKSLIKAESIKNNQLVSSINSLKSIIKQRTGSFFPTASIQSKHRSEYTILLKETNKILTEDKAIELNNQINELKNKIIKDLEIRDKNNSKLLRNIILGTIGLILTIIFWEIAIWILIIGLIILSISS